MPKGELSSHVNSPGNATPANSDAAKRLAAIRTTFESTAKTIERLVSAEGDETKKIAIYNCAIRALVMPFLFSQIAAENLRVAPGFTGWLSESIQGECSEQAGELDPWSLLAVPYEIEKVLKQCFGNTYSIARRLKLPTDPKRLIEALNQNGSEFPFLEEAFKTMTRLALDAGNEFDDHYGAKGPWSEFRSWVRDDGVSLLLHDFMIFRAPSGKVDDPEKVPAIRLGENDDSRHVWVFNRDKGEVSERAAIFLKILVKKYPKRAKGIELEKPKHKSDAAKVLKALSEKDEDWKAAILLAGQSYGGYGLAPLSADPKKAPQQKTQKNAKKTQ